MGWGWGALIYSIGAVWTFLIFMGMKVNDARYVNTPSYQVILTELFKGEGSERARAAGELVGAVLAAAIWPMVYLVVIGLAALVKVGGK